MPELMPAQVLALADAVRLPVSGDDLAEVTNRLNAFLDALARLDDLPRARRARANAARPGPARGRRTARGDVVTREGIGSHRSRGKAVASRILWLKTGRHPHMEALQIEDKIKNANVDRGLRLGYTM